MSYANDRQLLKPVTRWQVEPLTEGAVLVIQYLDDPTAT